MSVVTSATMLSGNSADGFNQQISGATAISSAGLTINAGDTGLVAGMSWATNVGSPAMTWNGSTMIARAVVNSGGAKIFMASQGTPASGAKTLAGSWTTGADCYMSGMTFKGSEGVAVVANTTVATNVTSIAVTSDTNGATVAFFAVDGGAPTVNFAKIYSEAPLGPGGGANVTTGGTNNIHTFGGAGGTVQALGGVRVSSAAVAAGGFTPPFWWGDLDGLGRRFYSDRLN